MAKKRQDEDLQLDLEEGVQNEDQKNQEGSKTQEESGEEGGEGDGQAETPQQVIEKLKKQLTDRENEIKSERERASKAEKETAETQKKATTAQEDALSAHETSVANALAHANSEIDALDSQYVAALEAGDARVAADVNRKLRQAEYKSLQLQDQQTQIKTYKENEKKRLENQPKQPELTDAQRQWLRDHPKYETDAIYRADTHSADNAARARGLAPGSTAYIKFLDNYLDRLHGEEEEAEEQPQPRNNRSVTSFAAPAGRTMPSNQGTDNKKPKLTEQQKAHCKEMGWDEANYLQNVEKAKARKQGR